MNQPYNGFFDADLFDDIPDIEIKQKIDLSSYYASLSLYSEGNTEFNDKNIIPSLIDLKKEFQYECSSYYNLLIFL